MFRKDARFYAYAELVDTIIDIKRRVSEQDF
jgi:hypothetical protein